MNRYAVCPSDAQSPYDEISHEIDSNFITVKLLKDKHQIQTEDGQAAEPRIADINCVDKYGKKCKKGCPKINLIHNETLTPKTSEEEMLLLKATRQVIVNDLKHSVEVEFKSPRNYIPLPEPGPPPPIIIPVMKESVIVKKVENKGKKKKLKQ